MKRSAPILVQQRPVPFVSKRPYLSTNVDDYIHRYWAVMFTSRTAAVRSAHVRHLVNWYCTRLKTVDMDHHIAARSMVMQLQKKGCGSQMPILFVNKKLVGTLEDLQKLEEEKKLKDILQFGFEWKIGAEKPFLMPAALGDKELFRGQYVGTPALKPVLRLPSLHPSNPG